MLFHHFDRNSYKKIVVRYLTGAHTNDRAVQTASQGDLGKFCFMLIVQNFVL